MTLKNKLIAFIMATANIASVMTALAAQHSKDTPQDSRLGGTTNLALMRPVKTSSCFDYNLTGQLITDGITSGKTPPSLTVTTAEGPVPRREREWAIDGGDFTRNTLMGEKNFLQYEWTGMSIQANSVGIVCSVAYDEKRFAGKYSIRVLMPGKKGEWRVVAEDKGCGLPGVPAKYKMHSDPNKQTANDFLPARNVRLSLPLPRGCYNISRMRVEFDMEGAVYWNVNNVNFFDGNRRLISELLPNSQFGSAWMSDGEGKQWAQVDLGAVADITSVKLAWIRRPHNALIEVSDDAKQWRQAATVKADGRQRTDNIPTPEAYGRYVRIAMDGGSSDAVTGSVPTKAYMLSEMEVYGRGIYREDMQMTENYADGRLSLNIGDWKVCRASEVKAPADKVATAKYMPDSKWIPATVPGTVLTSFTRYGALNDPNIADNIFDVSDSYFNSDFWYRRTFTVPRQMSGQHIMLNFDGINWKADVWINGKKVDRIEGAFTRSQVDITPYVNNAANTIAVLIHKNAHPGAVKEKNKMNTDFNGGVLGADNPTFHATTGWDWISTIRGRDIGIWNDVYLTSTADVVLSDPLVSTSLNNLPDTTATMTPRVCVKNVRSEDVCGRLRGWIGNLEFERDIKLKAGEQREIVFEPEDFPTLRNRDMRLWWPNGYGEPYLYDAGFRFEPADGTTRHNGNGTPATITYKAGIRQMTYADTQTQLKLYVNGRRLIPLGGNWGFSEANLQYGKREYDTAVRLHRDMNFNMIRNWVGMTGDEEFYDACDRYGIMVWQDFWLANPADGPDPDDENMFMQNARDFTNRMRRHPSIAIYCGRNEGYPPKSLDKQLRQAVDTQNPGLLYISSSADEGVSGHGPYWAEPPRTYFEKQTGKLHTERGMPNIMTIEGTSRTLGKPLEWLPGKAWGQHDFTQAGAQRGASFMNIVERMFGRITSAEQFTALAQWENYDGYRAMFEADSRYRQGLLIWMSHPCWPSFTWQCYDYYFEPTAAFYGARKACEPLHIQWNALTRRVEIVNRAQGDIRQLRAQRDILDIHGNVVGTASRNVNSANDTTTELRALATDSIPEGIREGVYFIRLTLADSNKRLLSSNFYVLSTDEGNLQQLNELPEVNLAMATERKDDKSLTISLRNLSPTPAMMIRLNLKADDDTQVLPVDYSDNYFHMMPGEERTLTVTWNKDDARAHTPFVEISGFNVKQRTLR